MALDFLVLAIGLVVLCAGTEVSVRGAVQLARVLRLSPMLIGLTLVAFGTDLPELIVAIRGAIETRAGGNASGIIAGNAVGSAICQISLVVGIVACFRPAQQVEKPGKGPSVSLLAAVLLVGLLAIDRRVSFAEGIILVAGFLGYLFLTICWKRKAPNETAAPDSAPRARPWIGIACLAAGLTAVILGAELVLEHAVAVADTWGVGQSFVGAVIVAAGTSLPELAISVGAVARGQPGLSLGNIIGSNVFDCLVPIGVAATIAPITVDSIILTLDLPLLLGVSALFLWFLRRDRNLTRLEGLFLCLVFAAYVAARFLAR